MLAGAADVPIELHDLILSFYECDKDGGDTWDDYQRRNYVAIDSQQRGSLRLVCHDWARALQPTVFKDLITLRDRSDVDALLGLLAKPECHIAEDVTDLSCEQSVTTYPVIPWIHALCLKAVPALPHFSESLYLDIRGPLPPGKSFSSIHGVLPKHTPNFAAGLSFLHLINLHFKSLASLFRLIRELPSLSDLGCTAVTWDTVPDEEGLKAISHLRRDTNADVSYWTTRCTDNAVAGWLLWRLAPTKSSRLSKEDSDALCGVTSEIVKIDTAQHADWAMASTCCNDYLSYKVMANLSEGDSWLTPPMRVGLAPPVSGAKTRRVRSVEFTFGKGAVRVPDMLGWDWSVVDARLADMDSLETVMLVFSEEHELLLFAREIVSSKMPRLRDSPRLKYMLQSHSAPPPLFAPMDLTMI